MATPTVVKSVARMQTAGLVTRRRDEADRRLVRVVLTEQGRAVQGAVEAARDELERRATATLSDAERRTLLRALRKIIEQLGDATPMG